MFGQQCAMCFHSPEHKKLNNFSFLKVRTDVFGVKIQFYFHKGDCAEFQVVLSNFFCFVCFFLTWDNVNVWGEKNWFQTRQCLFFWFLGYFRDFVSNFDSCFASFVFVPPRYILFDCSVSWVRSDVCAEYWRLIPSQSRSTRRGWMALVGYVGGFWGREGNHRLIQCGVLKGAR